jgi:hypothetical protein
VREERVPMIGFGICQTEAVGRHLGQCSMDCHCGVSICFYTLQTSSLLTVGIRRPEVFDALTYTHILSLSLSLFFFSHAM